MPSWLLASRPRAARPVAADPPQPMNAEPAPKPSTPQDENWFRELIATLEQVNGAEHVLRDAEECSFYAQDVFTQALPAAVVVRPDNIGQLAQTVAAASTAGCAVIPRGGGMSYSSGFVPAEPGSVLVDTGRMNRVLEINAQDMYVTVECGITWRELHQALQAVGLRTPYWGTLSGIRATVGGSLSQNSIFWGSGRYGSAADTVLSMDVVLADGSVLRTGSAAKRNATPFARHYGPDLGGVFTADCGALGFKAHATLRLMRELPARRYVSFAFADYREMLPAMSDIARSELAMECFGFDPYLQQQRMKRESLVKDARQFLGALKFAGGLYRALRDGAKMLLAGRRYMKDVAYSCHIIIEEASEAAAAQALREVRAIGRRHGGRELPDSIPRLVRANPFAPVNNMVGPEGERWVPVHSLVPHSKAVETVTRIEEYFQGQGPAMEPYHVHTGYLFATVSNHCFVVEPVFFWHDALTEIHRRSLEPDFLSRLKGFPEDLEARRSVVALRKGLIEVMGEQGAIHLQLGKSYPYREVLQPEAWRLVQAIKDAVDPEARLNPQALGLDTHRDKP